MFVKYNCTTQQVPRDVYIWIQARLCYLIMIKKKKKTQHKIMNFSSWLLPHPNRRFNLTGTEGTLLVDILLRYQWTHGEWFHTHTHTHQLTQWCRTMWWRRDGKVGRHGDLRRWTNTLKCMAFLTLCVFMVCTSTWRGPGHSDQGLNSVPIRASTGPLRSLAPSPSAAFLWAAIHMELAFIFLCRTPNQSCSSSSWSSSMASIWDLEQTSLMGAESSPSTTSSLDISLFL